MTNGMSIDEHIGVIEDLKSTMSVCMPEPEKTEICSSLGEAINTMRKYQKLERILDKIREQFKSHLRGVEITLEVLVANDPLRPKMEGAKETLEECLEIIDKAESEDKTE